MEEYANREYGYITPDNRLRVYIEHVIIQAFTRFNPSLNREWKHQLFLEQEKANYVLENKEDQTIDDIFREKIWMLKEQQYA